MEGRTDLAFRFLSEWGMAGSVSTLLALACLILFPAHAQSINRQQAATPTTSLSFDVASVKVNKDGPGLMMIRPMPGGQTYIARNVPLRLMIKAMYKVADVQIVGGADWIDRERYDIDAKVDRPATLDELHEMFRNLLAVRFQLRFHRERRLGPAYELTVSKSGAKLKRSEYEEESDVPIKPDGVATRASMPYLAFYLSQYLDAPVIDETALEGYYDFSLKLYPNNGPGLSRPIATGADGLDDNVVIPLRDQLGLVLRQRKMPVEFLVIDHAVKPEAN